MIVCVWVCGWGDWAVQYSVGLFPVGKFMGEHDGRFTFCSLSLSHSLLAACSYL